MKKSVMLHRVLALFCAACILFVLCGCEAGAAQPEDEDATARVVERLRGYVGNGITVTAVEDYALDDFEGVPCHALLMRTSDDRFFAYSVLSDQLYAFSHDAVTNYDGRLDTEEKRCCYLLWISDGGNACYVNSSEIRTVWSEQELAAINKALAGGSASSVSTGPEITEAPVQLPAQTAPGSTHPARSGQYTILAEYPELFTRRVLDDGAIAALKDADLQTLQEEISTPADFAAWIDTQQAPYGSNITSNGNGQRTFGADFSSLWYKEILSTPMLASLAVRILGDDIPGIGIAAVNMDYQGGVLVCGNVIPTDGGYYVFSLDTMSQQWQQTTNIMKEVFPLMQLTELSDLIAYCGSNDDISCPGGVFVQGFYLPSDMDVVLDCSYGSYTPQNPESVVEFYRDEEYIAGGEERQTGHIKPEFIDRYAISQMLGGTTLTAEEAYALLDMEPETVKERVKTAADVLMYMLAAKIGDCGGDRCSIIDGKEWHYNLNAFEVMEQRLANCGASANLANYLLEGDYEEIGFILHAYQIGNGGGHVYNYIRYEGKYYIVDFSWFIFGSYRPENDYPVMELNRLADYGNRVSEIYGGVCMVMAHTSPGQHFPNVFDDENAVYAIPAGTEYTLLYQENSPSSYQLAEYPLDKSKLDWTIFG